MTIGFRGVGVILRLNRDNGKENGNYYTGESNGQKWKMKWKLGLLWCIYRDYIGVIWG